MQSKELLNELREDLGELAVFSSVTVCAALHMEIPFPVPL
jgi:hypothetical protein